MKILTNVQQSRVGGITQTLASLAKHIEQKEKKKIQVVGVDIKNADNNYCPSILEPSVNFILRSIEVETKKALEVVKTAQTLEDVRKTYGPLIEKYHQTILNEKPDVILINGTYYLPWCLLLASQQFNIPTVLHYHGSLTKETEHIAGTPGLLLQQMEKEFDRKKLAYIFPSELLKKTVENEIFGHPVRKHAILPNSVPLHFFNVKSSAKKNSVGIVSRWAKVKNPEFCGSLARYNQKHNNKLAIHMVTDLGKEKKQRQMLNGVINFKKPMDNEKLARFYSRMSVIISPSRFETYGNVAKEALATGTPALISSNMGVAETFKKLGLEHWVVDFSSPGQVYKKIMEVTGQKVPQSVKNQLKEMYSPQAINSKMIEILKEA